MWGSNAVRVGGNISQDENPIESPLNIPIESPLNTHWQFGVHGKWNNGYPLKPIEIKTNWSPLKPIGFNRDLLVSMGTYWFQWGPIGLNGYPCCQLVSMGTNWFRFNWFQLVPIVSLSMYSKLPIGIQLGFNWYWIRFQWGISSYQLVSMGIFYTQSVLNIQVMLVSYYYFDLFLDICMQNHTIFLWNNPYKYLNKYS